MDLKLRDKIVLITGGSKGIGLACAKAFLAEGAAVAIASRSEANLANARTFLGTAFSVAADLVDDRAAARVVDAVERERRQQFSLTGQLLFIVCPESAHAEVAETTSVPGGYQSSDTALFRTFGC